MTHVDHGPAGGDVVLLGCGRLGSAILHGWMKTGAVDPARLIVLTPSSKPEAEAARAAGARINPPLQALAGAGTLVLAVKPAKWREAAAPLIPHLAAGAVVLSVMAGVGSDDLIDAFAGRPVARLMPTTGVRDGAGVAALVASDDQARRRAHALFQPIADVVEVQDEARLDAATAMAGCGPAYVFAMIAALARAGEGAGLSAEASARLARGVLRSAAAGAGRSGDMAALIDEVAPPGGVTEAGLKALAQAGLQDAVTAAIEAALARTRNVTWALTDPR